MVSPAHFVLLDQNVELFLSPSPLSRWSLGASVAGVAGVTGGTDVGGVTRALTTGAARGDMASAILEMNRQLVC